MRTWVEVSMGWWGRTWQRHTGLGRRQEGQMERQRGDGGGSCEAVVGRLWVASSSGSGSMHCIVATSY